MLVCSLCLRQHLSLCTECPSCRQDLTENKEFEPNYTVDEIVEAYSAIKKPLFEALNTRKESLTKRHQCPICRLFFGEKEIQEHASACIEKQAKADNKVKRQPLSKPVFTLMKDAQLKKLLIDYGLPSIGERQVQNRVAHPKLL